MLNVPALFAAVKQFSTDLRNKADLATIFADATAIWNIVGPAIPSVQPTPPALEAAPIGQHLSSGSVADRIDAAVAYHEQSGSQEHVGAGGAGALILKFLPLILQGLQAALMAA